MTDVEQLFTEYVAQHRAGDADPRPFLSRAEGGERIELAALIDGYLARSPGREWDAEAFKGSPAQLAAEQIAGGWDLEEGGEAGAEEALGWRELLPALRNQAQVMRRELVAKLADAVGHPGEAGRIGAYYHQMETGKLPAEGVSNRVLEALGGILGESAERLRAAGSVVHPGGETELGAQERIAFARTAAHDPRFVQPAPPQSPGTASPGEVVEASIETPREESVDEVDRLFTGGPDAA
jgi:hypothetical protein